MIYRPLTEADIEAYLALESYAFNINPDRSGLDGPKMARFRGLFAGPTLATQLECIPLRVRTGLGEIAAVGIGSVATAPEYRRQGHVATLLRHLVDELRAAGVTLAILYPFKRSFYGRYGWATFFERRIYQGDPALLAGFRLGPGGFVRASAAEIPELDRIYRRALHGRFGLLVRDETWWREQVLHDWERRPWNAYIWRDTQGQGRSYLVYRLEQHGQGQRLFCREIAACDPESRAQLFAFLAAHQDQVATVRFPAPADAPVNLLFPDPLECGVEPHFMLRLLDVAGAFAGYTYGREARGRLTLAVRDDWISANQGVYELVFEHGRCQVRRLADDAPAGLQCDVRALAQIYSRYLRPRTAAAFGVLDVVERADLELLEQAFAGLAPFCSDFF
ncbi:MAG: GNAT family N-acetyltransferase [Chloroflexi bacterium OHK40]